MFFPPPIGERKADKVARERKAKAICDACSVRSECFEYAISIGEQHGIWGGHNELERRRYLRAV